MLQNRKPILFVIFCSGVGFMVGLGGRFVYTNSHAKTDVVPNLVGTWVGENRTVSDKKGYKIWGEKTVEITEQQDRRFRGHFTYPDGTKNFFGVIFPDNSSFAWVSSNSKGYNHGRILDTNHLGACYIESGTEATAGCAELKRKQ